jgi:hypothetical protein
MRGTKPQTSLRQLLEPSSKVVHGQFLQVQVSFLTVCYLHVLYCSLHRLFSSRLCEQFCLLVSYARQVGFLIVNSYVLASFAYWFLMLGSFACWFRFLMFGSALAGCALCVNTDRVLDHRTRIRQSGLETERLFLVSNFHERKKEGLQDSTPAFGRSASPTWQGKASSTSAVLKSISVIFIWLLAVSDHLIRVLA